MARWRGASGVSSAFGGMRAQIQVPKLTGGNSNLLRGRPERTPPGRGALIFGILLIMVCLAVGIGGFVSLTEELPYRAGWAGEPGTLSLVFCRTIGSDKGRHADCDGEFRADTRAQPTLVDIEGDNAYASDRAYPARLHSDGQTASVVGGKMVAYILAGMFVALGFIIGIGWTMVYGSIIVVMWRFFGRSWRMRRSPGAVPVFVGGVLVLFGFVSWIVGNVLSI